MKISPLHDKGVPRLRSGLPSVAGQALVELAVFGSIFILILAAVLSYGLRYNNQQRLQMLSFRRALKIASDENRGSGGYMIVEDRNIPDPMGIFGIGKTTPTMATASVTRDYQMHTQAVDAESLEGGLTDIQTNRDNNGSQWMRRFYKSAGFRFEYGVSEDQKGKYEVIYGGTSIRDDGGGTIRIIDRCSGELMSYEACFRQARMLVDTGYCTQICNDTKTPGAELDCAGECGKATNPPNQSNATFNSANGGAWYAVNYSYVPCGTDRCYTFPILNQMFAFSGLEAREASAMGIQSVGTMNTLRDESIGKIETPSEITTDESVNWSDTLDRTLVHQDNLDTGGYEIPHSNPADYVNVQVDTVQSVVSGSAQRTMETDK